MKLSKEEKAQRRLEREEQKEEQKIEFYAFQLRQLRERWINEPTIQYHVGQRVQHGSVKKSIVKTVLNDGKIYELHEINTKSNYGNPYDVERDMYVMWTEILPYTSAKENAKREMFFKEDELVINFSQRTIDSLLHCHYNFGIDIEPDYQRGNVWALEDKMLLIESIFQNIDIGKFTLIHRKFESVDNKNYEILDGKQRLIALMEFYENRFQYCGKYYRDMCFRDRSHFRNYSISWGEAKYQNGEGNIPDKVKYRYFLKLNTGGKPVDPAHIEKVQKMLANLGGSNEL